MIFDLDDTLVDTQALRGLRDSRAWKAAVGSLESTAVFPGIEDLLSVFAREQIPWAVVTTAVSYYAAAVLRHHGLGSPPVVAYHDAQPKPSPDCTQRALKHLNVDAAQVVAVGDHRNDHTSYSAAGVLSIGAGWSPVLQDAEWDAIIATPAEIMKYL